jgi:hypothetical protein
LGVGVKSLYCCCGSSNRNAAVRGALGVFAPLVCALAVLVANIAAAQAPDAKPLTLLAAAADAGAAVFDDGGTLHKIAVGDALPGLPWKLAAVRDARVVLDAQRRFDGQRLSLELAVGERVDPAALAALDAAQQPLQTYDIQLHAEPRHGARKPVKPGKP